MATTSDRRQGQSLHIDLPNGEHSLHPSDLPSVAALFLILFDVKAGYTIAWKRSIAGLDLDESVEFKSLPSGLHHVEEDLIYFIHGDDYAGISAFKNSPSEEQGDRNALMLAVGALVPLSLGRMGKSWKLAEDLKELARGVAQNPKKMDSLEDFWLEHQLHEENSQEETAQNGSPSVDRVRRRQTQPQSNGHVRTRNRAISTASALAPPGQSLSSHHPALSLPNFLDTFGPLIFPIYKAALLRKRLLIVGHGSVELACNWVYDISILSGIPSSVIDLLPLEPLPTRLHSLFSVGIHDTTLLSPPSPGAPSNGWIACTTDDILAHKPQLYDTLITLPPPHSAQAKQKTWPTIKPSPPTAPATPPKETKATQRDLRRYRTLRRELHSLSLPTTATASTTPHPNPHSPHYTAKLSPTTTAPSSPTLTTTAADNSETTSTHSAAAAEPPSWPALAYDSFMWWASAGEKRTDLNEEEEGDASLLRPARPHPSHPGSGRSPARRRGSTATNLAINNPDAGGEDGTTPGGESGGGRGVEMCLIAYFHHFTTLILKTLADVVDAAEDDADGLDVADVAGHAPTPSTPPATDDPPASLDIARDANNDNDNDDTVTATTTAAAVDVIVEAEDMTRMGLDGRSSADREFVVGLVELYWGRGCVVRSGGVDFCGVRLC